MSKRARTRKNADPNQIAKAILDAMDGPDEIEPTEEEKKEKADRRKGGKKGGASRAKKLTKAERSAIAKKAAEARWGKSNAGD